MPIAERPKASDFVDGRPVVERGYFGDDAALFGVLHRPLREPRDLGVVICGPLHYEAMQTYRSLRVLASELAAAGLATLRFDYHGTGESRGSDEDPGRLAAWRASLDRAIDTLREATGVARVALVGLRFGGLLALDARARRPLATVALWEPCCSGAGYVRELEIMAAGGRGGEGASEAGLPFFEAAGFGWSAETMAEVRRLEPLAAAMPPALPPDGPAAAAAEPAPSMILIEREDRPERTRDRERLARIARELEVLRLPGHDRMMRRPDQSEVPRAIVNALVGAFCARSSPCERRSPPEQGMRSTSVEAGIERSVAQFGDGEALFGVMTRALAADAPSSRGYVFLVGGVVPRTAVNRMYVRYADRLAVRGSPSLRMDASGIGESPARGRSPENVPYPKSFEDDVGAGIDHLLASQAVREVTLVGLCSGAFAAFRAAQRRPEVTSLVLVSPLAFRWQEPMPSDATPEQALSRLLRKGGPGPRRGFVAKVWGLLAEPTRVFTVVRRRWTIVSGVARLRLRRYFPVRTTLRADLEALHRRGVRITIAFAQGDPGHASFLEQTKGGPADETMTGVIDLRIFPEADHTFSTRRASEALFRSVWDTTSPSGKDP